MSTYFTTPLVSEFRKHTASSLMNFLLRNGTNQLGNMSLRGNGTLTVDTLDSLGCYRSLDFTGNVKVAVGGKTCENAVDEDERVKLRKIKKNHFSQVDVSTDRFTSG